MRVYIHNAQNVSDEDLTNAFLILTDQERDHLKSCYEDLLTKLEQKRVKGTLKKWNKYDAQALQFITKMFHWKDGGEMLDITIKQTYLVDKALAKVYKKKIADFCIWANLESSSNEWLSRAESFDNMEHKRQMKKKWLGEQASFKQVQQFFD